jgi:tetratricopeptide (TPR) repeat protein
MRKICLTLNDSGGMTPEKRESSNNFIKAYMSKMPAFLLHLFIAVLYAELTVQAQQPKPSPSPQGSVQHTPQAKTQAEYADYNTAYTISTGAAMEKAANDFAARYPESELRSYLYAKAMHNYQAENNPPKMLAMGEKVLTYDPDNSIALVLTATVLSDDLMENDPEAARKVAEIRKNAGLALQTIDTSFVPPTSATAEQTKAYKDTLRSMAHSAIGIMSLKEKDNVKAEAELKLSADLVSAAPDPYIWYHLALAQDHQGKYAEALQSVQKALNYTSSNPELGKLAAGERDRLVLLTRRETPAGQQAPGNSSQPPR